MTNDHHELAPLDGLAQLKRIMAGHRPPFAEKLGFDLVDVGEGYAVFEGEPDETIYNPMGTVHGGYISTLLDSACGCAAHSRLTASQSYTTLELKVAFHRAVGAQSGRVRARADLLSFGRRAAFAEAKLVDASGRLCASATSTLIILNTE